MTRDAYGHSRPNPSLIGSRGALGCEGVERGKCEYDHQAIDEVALHEPKLPWLAPSRLRCPVLLRVFPLGHREDCARRARLRPERHCQDSFITVRQAFARATHPRIRAESHTCDEVRRFFSCSSWQYPIARRSVLPSSS